MNPTIESPNEAMYRRLEGLYRGPPILMALADGEVWTTKELAFNKRRRHARNAAEIKRVYNVLHRYVQRGLVRRVPLIHETFRLPNAPLPGCRLKTRTICELLGICRGTLLKMHETGAFPAPVHRGLKSSKQWNVEDVRQAFEKGLTIKRKARVRQWQITPEGLITIRGNRR